MATRKAKRAQGSEAINQSAEPPDIPDSEIDKWCKRQPFERIEELAPIVAAMDKAAITGDVEKLKEFARKHGGMLRRLARSALMGITQKNGWARTHSTGHALDRLYALTGDYRRSLESFTRRALGNPRPGIVKAEIAPGREDRKAERYAIAEVLFGDFSPDTQPMVDCMFACLTASKERLSEVRSLLARTQQEGGEG
jgi:hypothetical protein